jgi:hypothetical protein
LNARDSAVIRVGYVEGDLTVSYENAGKAA